MANVDTALSRFARISFAPPPRPNLISTISYVDVDNDTGERTPVPIVEFGRRAVIYRALLKMSLVELAHRLKIDWDNPPLWLPSADEAIAWTMAAMETELHDRLLEEIREEAVRADLPPEQAEPQDQAPIGQILNLPSLFSSIGIAFQEVLENESARNAFISPRDEDRDEFVDKIVDGVEGEALSGLLELFDKSQSSVEEAVNFRLCAKRLSDGDAFEPLGVVDDLTVATSIAWATNLATSGASAQTDRIGFWLCDRNEEVISPVKAVQIEPNADGVQFEMALSAALGASELRQMNEALAHLVQIWGSFKGFK